MQSILIADTDFLYSLRNEVDDRLSDFHISAYESEYLSALKKQIDTELFLRKNSVSYEKCIYRHENGNCQAIGGFCSSNGYGDSLDLCQLNRIKTITNCVG